MKKLDLYILKKFLTTFVFVVSLLVLIICVIDFTEKNDNYIRYEVSGDLIFKYYLTFIPFIIGLLTPITVFIATVFVTANMAGRTEIIAILASGVSFRRMMFPYLIGATAIAVASFFLNSDVIPDSNKFRIDFELNYLGKPFANKKRHMHFKVGEDLYIYIEKYNVNNDEGRNVTLEQIKDNQLVQKLSASRVRWNPDSANWRFMEYDIRRFGPMEEEIIKGEELDSLINMSPEDFDNKERFFETLTMRELKDYISLLSSRGADDVGIYEIEKYIRYMQPFTVIILTFIGIIVAARKSRGGTGFQIALGFLIAFLFIIVFIFSRAIAEAQTMHPVLAVWLPNIAFSMVGLVMYFTVPR